MNFEKMLKIEKVPGLSGSCPSPGTFRFAYFRDLCLIRLWLSFVSARAKDSFVTILGSAVKSTVRSGLADPLGDRVDCRSNQKQPVQLGERGTGSESL